MVIIKKGAEYNNLSMTILYKNKTCLLYTSDAADER